MGFEAAQNIRNSVYQFTICGGHKQCQVTTMSIDVLGATYV